MEAVTAPEASAVDASQPSFDAAPIEVRAAEPDAEIAPGGLVGYWKLDEGQGNGTADSSMNANHGSLQNGPGWVMGRNGRALSFTDQKPTHVRVASSSTVNGIASALSIAAWVYTLGSGWQQTILSRQVAGSTEQRFSFRIFQANLEFRARGVKLEHALSPFPGDQWVHLAMTWDEATVRFYVNGALVRSGPVVGSLAPDSTPVLIGAEQEGPNLWSSMNGMLDEVRLYDRVLGATEMAALAR